MQSVTPNASLRSAQMFLLSRGDIRADVKQSGGKRTLLRERPELLKRNGTETR